MVALQQDTQSVVDANIRKAWQSTGEYIYKGIRAFEVENNLVPHNVKFEWLLPSPDTLKFYENKWPGSVDRILDLADGFMAKDHKLEKEALRQKWEQLHEERRIAILGKLAAKTLKYIKSFK